MFALDHDLDKINYTSVLFYIELAKLTIREQLLKYILKKHSSTVIKKKSTSLHLSINRELCIPPSLFAIYAEKISSVKKMFQFP